MSRFAGGFGFYLWYAGIRSSLLAFTRRIDMHQRHLLLAGIAAALSSACSPSPEVPTAAGVEAAHAAHAHSAAARITNGDLTPEQLKSIADVRKATQLFHDFALATAPTSQGGGGYTTQYPAGCAASPNDGAQGVHYLNTDLVDANVELLRPELVMYEPGPNGQMNLVGVDYIVPLALSATPPTLLGVPFAPLGPPLNVWALHIWAWRPNPSGPFALWNPKVSCEFAK
jgi:hypothetical protein